MSIMALQVQHVQNRHFDVRAIYIYIPLTCLNASLTQYNKKVPPVYLIQYNKKVPLFTYFGKPKS